MKSFVFSNIVTTYNLQLVTTSEKTRKLKNTGRAGANKSRAFEIFFRKKISRGLVYSGPKSTTYPFNSGF